MHISCPKNIHFSTGKWNECSSCQIMWIVNFSILKYITTACKLEELHHSSFFLCAENYVEYLSKWVKCAQFSPYPGKIFLPHLIRHGRNKKEKSSVWTCEAIQSSFGWTFLLIVHPVKNINIFLPQLHDNLYAVMPQFSVMTAYLCRWIAFQMYRSALRLPDLRGLPR